MKKEFRVKKGSEIEKIIKAKNSVGNKYFVLYKLHNLKQDHFRFALSISKKFGKAVRRNKIKRQVRDIFSKNLVKPDVDLFLVIKPKAGELEYQEMKQMLESMMKQQKILR
jgi:ribonuclease P protein component